MLENKVKEARKEKGMTQVELCKEAHISRETLAKIENGRVNTIRIATAANIANALGVKANDIFCF